MSISTILLILLVLLLIGALPTWPYSGGWGYYPSGGLGLVVIILLVLLLFVLARSLGLVSVPVAIALLVLVTRNAHAWVEEVVVYGMTWLLLLTGLRIALAHGIEAGDAGILRDRTHIPRRFWSLLWIGGTLLAVVIGGKWMVLRS